jgi:hypothetical protein
MTIAEKLKSRTGGGAFGKSDDDDGSDKEEQIEGQEKAAKKPWLADKKKKGKGKGFGKKGKGTPFIMIFEPTPKEKKPKNE